MEEPLSIDLKQRDPPTGLLKFLKAPANRAVCQEGDRSGDVCDQNADGMEASPTMAGNECFLILD